MTRAAVPASPAGRAALCPEQDPAPPRPSAAQRRGQRRKAARTHGRLRWRLSHDRPAWCRTGCRGHDGPRRVMWAGPGLLVRRRSCPRRPGCTMTWFYPEPRWAAEMAPHVIDVPRGLAPAVRGQDGCTVAISGEMSIASVPVLRERMPRLAAASARPDRHRPARGDRLRVACFRQLPGRCAEVAPGAADPGWFLIQGEPPVAVSALP
jgi:hypothetical protein